MLNLQDTAVPNSDVVVTELDGEGVLLNLDTKMYYSLNATGLYIWQRLGEEVSLGEIGQQLQQEYGVRLDKAEQSVLDLVKSLQCEQLVILSHG